MTPVSLFIAAVYAVAAFTGAPRDLPVGRYCILNSRIKITRPSGQEKDKTDSFREKMLLKEDPDTAGQVILHVENLDITQGVIWSDLYFPRAAFQSFIQNGSEAKPVKAVLNESGIIKEVPPSSVQQGANLLAEIFPMLSSTPKPQKVTLKLAGKSWAAYRYRVNRTKLTRLSTGTLMSEKQVGSLWMSNDAPFGLLKGDIKVDLSFDNKPGIYQTQRIQFELVEAGTQK